MSEGALWRLAIGLGTSLGGVGWLAYAGWSWRGIGGVVLVFVAGSALAEAVYRRMATRDEIRADLTDRVRNPD